MDTDEHRFNSATKKRKRPKKISAFCFQFSVMPSAASRLLNENTSLFCPSPHRMGRGIKGEVLDLVCATRTISHAQLQIELKPHTAVKAVAALQETQRPYKTGLQERGGKSE